MTTRSFRVALVFFLLNVIPSVAWAQDALARAKDYYAAAAYEDALKLLESLGENTPAGQATEIAVYRMYCLLALERTDEAKSTIQSIVRAQPLYRPSASEASPKTRALYEQVRRPLIPEIIRESYTRAKEAFDRKELAAAVSGFEMVIALLDETEPADGEGVADLRTLAAGFRDLAAAASTPPPAPPPAVPAPPPASEPEPVPAMPEPLRIYTQGDLTVVKPVATWQPMPPWRPVTPRELSQSFTGTLELVIDQEGQVSSAVLRKNVHPLYDKALLQATKNWKFKPATLDGAPVNYRYLMEISLRPGT